MNREEWKERLPVIQAFVEGKRIEVKTGSTWLECDDPHFHRSLYRIAPEPKLRPWTAEDVPLGAWVRRKGNKTIAIITGFDPDAKFPIHAHPWAGSAQCFLNQHEHSTDGGKTWLPCGVLEGEK